MAITYIFQEYNLALWQCYGRYLKHFGDIDVEEITEVPVFKSTFFPDGFEADNAGFTVRGCSEKEICYHFPQTSRKLSDC